MPVSSSFEQKKQEILRLLNEPDDTYDDLSPKGSVDAEIRDFIDEINTYAGLVTTSSCSGRISVFLEGQKSEKKNGLDSEVDASSLSAATNDERLNLASEGGKGGGGRWLYVSHQPLDRLGLDASQLMEMFQLQANVADKPKMTSHSRFIHFKFEPMILHILAASIADAQKVLSAAQQAGFRESGIASIQGQDGPVMVAARTTGLSFDSVVGVLQAAQHEGDGEVLAALVDASYIAMLVDLANEKFNVNTERTQKFQKNLHEKYFPPQSKNVDWEDADVRRERKRAEGLRRKEELKRLAEKNDKAGISDETQDTLVLALNGE